jgi:hypothetical protein
MKAFYLIIFCLITNITAFSQEDRVDYNDDYWTFGNRDVADYTNAENFSENIQYSVKITYLPIENTIDGRGKYLNDKKDSIWTGFYNTGQAYFTEYYSKGKLNNGISFDAKGNQYHYKKQTIFARPLKGWDDFINYVQRYWSKVADFIEYRYPDNYQLLKNKEIAVSFELIITETGNIDIGEIANGKNYGCDKIAARKMLTSYKGKWMTALFRGQKVASKVKYTVFIKF